MFLQFLPVAHHQIQFHQPLGLKSLPTVDRPDGLVQMVAALVKDIHSPERETITILNTSNSEISLDGWMMIADKQKNKMYLDGSLISHECIFYNIRHL